ncbi:MAG: hypothetical protein EBR82_23920 [Caulobacteraceae bacterium]|nr:hypothetical protein [Caulobacteraceae bacterium]
MSFDEETRDPAFFCIKPFVELNITPSGTARPCCIFSPSIQSGGMPMSVYTHSVGEIWNSDFMRDVRKRIVEGEAVPECNHCLVSEQRGEASLRQIETEAWRNGWLNEGEETVEQLKAHAAINDYRRPAGPEWLSLEFGNLCNLKCRMCTPQSSSGVAADEIQARWLNGFASSARWKGRSMRIAPERVEGVEYRGVSNLDPSVSTSTAWIAGSATLVVRDPPQDASGVRIRLRVGEGSHGPVRVWIDGALHELGVDQILDARIPLPQQAARAETLRIRFQFEGVAALSEISLLREKTGRNSVGLATIGDGKPWFQSPPFLHGDLLGSSDRLLKLSIVGGEPFLIKEAVSFMEKVAGTESAEDTTLYLTTNGTVIGDDILSLFGNFKHTHIGVSLDGFDHINSYIRYPSIWSEIHETIVRFQSTKNVTIGVNCTFQAYNMMNVTHLAEYCDDMGIDLRFFTLEYPDFLSAFAMPSDAILLAARKIRHTLATRQWVSVGSTSTDITSSLDDLARSLETFAAGHDARKLRDFMAYTNDLDRSRGQKFAAVNPELFSTVSLAAGVWNLEHRFSGPSAHARTRPASGALI